jgi:hypothetical protein
MRRADRLFDIIQRRRTARGPMAAAALAEEARGDGSRGLPRRRYIAGSVGPDRGSGRHWLRALRVEAEPGASESGIPAASLGKVAGTGDSACHRTLAGLTGLSARGAPVADRTMTWLGVQHRASCEQPRSGTMQILHDRMIQSRTYAHETCRQPPGHRKPKQIPSLSMSDSPKHGPPSGGLTNGDRS